MAPEAAGVHLAAVAHGALPGLLGHHRRRSRLLVGPAGDRRRRRDPVPAPRRLARRAALPRSARGPRGSGAPAAGGAVQREPRHAGGRFGGGGHPGPLPPRALRRRARRLQAPPVRLRVGAQGLRPAGRADPVRLLQRLGRLRGQSVRPAGGLGEPRRRAARTARGAPRPGRGQPGPAGRRGRPRRSPFQGPGRGAPPLVGPAEALATRRLAGVWS